MTEMRRATVAIPDELDKRIVELKRSNPELARASYSKVVRLILDKGLNAIKMGQSEPSG